MQTMRQQRVQSSIKVILIFLNCLLVLQYVLGMIVNLFGDIPFDQIEKNTGSFLEKTGLAFGYARISPFLALQLHWLNACLLILASIALIILGAIVHKKTIWILALLLSLIFSAATISGASFIAYAGNDYYSFSMAVAFIIAFIIDIFLLFSVFVSRKQGSAVQEKVRMRHPVAR